MMSIEAGMACYGRKPETLLPESLNTHSNVNEILREFQTPTRTNWKVAWRMDGSFNHTFKRDTEVFDQDITDRVKQNGKIYHMSSYNHVQEPEIVTKNKALRNSKIESMHQSIGDSITQVKKGKARYMTKTPLQQLSHNLDPETSPVAEYPFQKINTDFFIPEIEECSNPDDHQNQITLDARVRKNSSALDQSKMVTQDLDHSPNWDISMSILEMPEEEKKGEISNLLTKYFVPEGQVKRDSSCQSNN